jgi:hypothetical protein
MATTETRSGFRLPWTGGDEAHHDDQLGTPSARTVESQASADAEPTVETSMEAEATAEAQPEQQPVAEAPVAEVPVAEAQPDPPAIAEPSMTRAADPTPPPAPESPRPNEFLAGLTRAMRTAAEAEREQILARFEDDVRAFTSSIRERSADQADALRQRADEDIEGIHAWSERELARIREETDRRIERRRTRLDEELESNTAEADHQAERVEATVEAFDHEMTRFFEGLLAEDDPARFAALAASLPMPPSLEAEATRPDPAPAPEPVAPEPDEASWSAPTSDEPAEAPTASAETDPWRDMPMSAPTEDTVDEPPQADAVTVEDTVDEPVQADAATVDPRVAMLGLTPDFAAAEAEAAEAVEAGPGHAEADAPSMDGESVAARLAGLTQQSDGESGATTRLVVVGLVSVASIAGFKRQLGRMPGVAKVGVSSGPDGEFVFTVAHAEGLDLRDPITTLPGYGARVVGAADDELRIECTDPESNG